MDRHRPLGGNPVETDRRDLQGGVTAGEHDPVGGGVGSVDDVGGGGKGDADVAVEHPVQVVVLGDHGRSPGVPVAPADRVGVAQVVLDRAVPVVHPVRPAAQGTQELHRSDGGEGRIDVTGGRGMDCVGGGCSHRLDQIFQVLAMVGGGRTRGAGS